MRMLICNFNETTVVLVVLRAAGEATLLGIFSLQKCASSFLGKSLFLRLRKVEKWSSHARKKN